MLNAVRELGNSGFLTPKFSMKLESCQILYTGQTTNCPRAWSGSWDLYFKFWRSSHIFRIGAARCFKFRVRVLTDTEK